MVEQRDLPTCPGTVCTGSSPRRQGAGDAKPARPRTRMQMARQRLDDKTPAANDREGQDRDRAGRGMDRRFLQVAATDRHPSRFAGATGLTRLLRDPLTAPPKPGVNAATGQLHPARQDAVEQPNRIPFRVRCHEIETLSCVQKRVIDLVTGSSRAASSLLIALHLRDS